MVKADQLLTDALSRVDSSAVLASILANTSIAITMISADGQVTFVNEAYCRMTGFERLELIARHEDDLLHPDDLEINRSERGRLLQAETDGFEFERRYVRKNGQILWTKGSASLQRDRETGKPLFIINLITDITGLKDIAERERLVEKALAERERLYVTLRSIGDAVICTDAASLVTFMNPMAEKLTGWNASEATARPVTEVFNIIEEASGKPPASPVEQCMRGGKACTVESGTILLSRTGDAYDIGFSAAPVTTPADGTLGSIVIFNDVTQVRADQKRVTRSAFHDALTGLPNRAVFMIRLQNALDEAREQDRIHALCFIDLDRFKLVNDRGGHAAGDALLSHVAKIIGLSCSSKDVPARLGGDEFAVLIRDCTASEAEATANAIVRAIGNIEFRWEAQLFRIGASIGATMISRASPGLADLLNEADMACYNAKNSGRGQVCIRTPKHEAGTRDDERLQAKWMN